MAPGSHTPAQAPLTQAFPEHAAPSRQAPVVSHVWTTCPLHCVAAGVHVPEHAPPLQMPSQGVSLCRDAVLVAIQRSEAVAHPGARDAAALTHAVVAQERTRIDAGRRYQVLAAFQAIVPGARDGLGSFPSHACTIRLDRALQSTRRRVESRPRHTRRATRCRPCTRIAPSRRAPRMCAPFVHGSPPPGAPLSAEGPPGMFVEAPVPSLPPLDVAPPPVVASEAPWPPAPFTSPACAFAPASWRWRWG